MSDLLHQFKAPIRRAGIGAIILATLGLTACSGGIGDNTVDVSVRFSDAEGIQSGDDVEFGGVSIGKVNRVVVGDEDATVELELDADKAGVVQKDAAAVVTGVTDRSIKIVNPTDSGAEALAISDGDNLHGLNSALEEAAWHAGKAIGIVQGVLREATGSLESYFESEDWLSTKRDVEQSLRDLSEQSSEAADSIRKNVEQLLAELELQSDETMRQAEDTFEGLEKQFKEFSEDGGNQIGKSLQELLNDLRTALENGRDAASTEQSTEI